MILLSILLVLCQTVASIDTWCGKVYRSSDPASNPGGRLEKPRSLPYPMLDLQIQPRMRPYLEEDDYGFFIIDTPLSNIDHDASDEFPVLAQEDAHLNLYSYIWDSDFLSFDIYRNDTNDHIAVPGHVSINTTGTTVGFPLNIFAPSFEPYIIRLVASGASGHKYTAFTQLLRLPKRNDGGSVAKIDNMFGALLVKDVDGSWKPLLPYSFYLNGNWLAESQNNMAVFRAYGYNVLHIVPAGGLGYNFTQLDEWLDEAQRVGLWVMYDMRWTYQNSSFVEWQVNRLKSRPNLLLWYTADEPGMSIMSFEWWRYLTFCYTDGQVDPLSAPQDAYSIIKSLDPYHPVSLCLNCENYHFQEYAAGADIILSDVYPVGTNTTWSTRYE